MSVYDDFRDAWVDHSIFGNRNAQLAEARWRMRDDAYEEQKYREAVFSAERIAAAYRRAC